jgi:putative ABC transport system permease protein
MQARLFTRLIFRSREVYALKVLTLAVAFAAFFIIVRFSEREFTFDEFNKQPDRVFRVLERNDATDYSGNRWSSRIPAAITAQLYNVGYRDAMVVSRVKILQQVNIGTKGKSFMRRKLHAADASILRVFNFDVLNGCLEEFEQARDAVVLLSEQAAFGLLGTREASGKHLMLFTYGDTVSVRVAAVFRDFPSNTHEEFKLFIRYDEKTLKGLHFSLEESSLYGRSLTDEPGKLSATVLSGLNTTSSSLKYSLQPLPAIYFGPRVLGEEAQHGDRYSILILICITTLILFLAVATYINLTTLSLPHRAKELAIRKLAGEQSGALLSDFLKESFAIVAASFLLSLLILVLCEPWWQAWLGIDTRELFGDPGPAYMVAVAVLIVLVTLAPLGLMRRFVKADPTRLLSSDTITFPRLKSIMAFLQLGTGIFLIVASVVVRRQINYSLVKEPGTNYDQIVYLQSPPGLTARGIAALRAQWKQTNANVVDVMGVSQLPGRLESREIGGDPATGGSPFYLLYVDPGFRDFFGLRMKSGNWFKANDGDSIIVVNEAAAALLKKTDPRVIGVVEDPSLMFNEPAKPVKIRLEYSQTFNWLCVRLLEVNIRRTVGDLSRQLASPQRDARIQYLDPGFASWISYQDRLNHVSQALAILSMILSCISIYGLSVSIVRDKTRQIAVHRLFGARTSRLTYLLTRAFAIQALLALAFFGPLIYMVVKELLRTFVYATKLQWMDAVYPIGYCTLVISFVCFVQAVSLNRSNFASALKDA